MLAALETEQQLFVQQRAMHELFSSLAIILECASDAVKHRSYSDVVLERFYFLPGPIELECLECVVLVGQDTTTAVWHHYICLSEDREAPKFSYEE